MVRTRIIFASDNPNKFQEVATFLDGGTFPNIILECWRPSSEIVEIQSLDRQEIVAAKLDEVYQQLDGRNDLKPSDEPENIWLVVEDTSLVIDELGGFPGPFVKFFLSCMPLTKICHIASNSTASAIVSLGAYKLSSGTTIQKDGNEHLTFVEGIIRGLISHTPRGSNGFGYDSIFVPIDGDNINIKTNAEMTTEEKNNINPRIIAFIKLFQQLLISI